MEVELALALVGLLILLDLAALKWGAESRDGFHNPHRRYPPVIDPFFTELAGRDRRERYLAEAEREQLLAAVRRPGAARHANPLAAHAATAQVVPLAALALVFAVGRRARSATVQLAAAAVGRIGVALVVMGVRLQRVALSQDADVECATC